MNPDADHNQVSICAQSLVMLVNLLQPQIHKLALINLDEHKQSIQAALMLSLLWC